LQKAAKQSPPSPPPPPPGAVEALAAAAAAAGTGVEATVGDQMGWGFDTWVRRNRQDGQTQPVEHTY